MVLEKSSQVCKRCGKSNIIKYGYAHGRQRYLCKDCKLQYTTNKTNTFDMFHKILAVILFLSGLSQCATANIVGASSQTVMNWLREFYKEFVAPKANLLNVTQIEMDEMHHYKGNKKNKLWIWKAMDHVSKKLIGWTFGGRDTQTFQKMYEKMNFSECPHIFSDYYQSYAEFFPSEKLTQSKTFTVAIERNNGRQRHWLACFRRRSIVVTKSEENLEIMMGLFARFHINGSMQELTSMLRLSLTQL